MSRATTLSPRRAALLAEARSWVGTPFRHQGRDKGEGVDCVGLVLGVGLALGLPGIAEIAAAPGSRVYRPRPARYALLRRLQALCRQVPKEAARPGDLLCLLVGDNPQHVLLLDEGRDGSWRVIHAASEIGTGRVLRQRLPAAWWARSAAFVLPGLD